MRGKEEKRARFGVANIVWALVSFAVFMVIGLGGYYLSVGEFVTAQLAGIYAMLALVGAAAVLLRMHRFVVFYYLGCVLGWAAGWFISGLKGEFAPTAGNICTFFLIGMFTLFGVIAQWQAIRKKLARRKEEREKAKAEAEADRLRLELEEAKKERETAEAVLESVAKEEAPLAASGAEEKKSD